MDKKKEQPKRKKNRLENYDYSLCGAYFLTVCTAERRNYFWSRVGATIGRPPETELSAHGKIVEEAIHQIPAIYPAISVEHYAIMPDHLHLLLVIHPDENGRPMVAPTVSRIVQQMKGYVTKRIGASIWQKLFFDHVIRDKQDFDEHIRYICENPTRWIIEHSVTDESSP